MDKDDPKNDDERMVNECVKRTEKEDEVGARVNKDKSW